MVLHNTLHFQMMWSEFLEEDVRSLSSLIKHSACMKELILVLAQMRRFKKKSVRVFDCVDRKQFTHSKIYVYGFAPKCVLYVHV